MSSPDISAHACQHTCHIKRRIALHAMKVRLHANPASRENRKREQCAVERFSASGGGCGGESEEEEQPMAWSGSKTSDRQDSCLPASLPPCLYTHTQIRNITLTSTESPSCRNLTAKHPPDRVPAAAPAFAPLAKSGFFPGAPPHWQGRATSTPLTKIESVEWVWGRVCGR